MALSGLMYWELQVQPSCAATPRIKLQFAHRVCATRITSTDLALGLEAIARLRPVTFNWKDSGQADLGFVAEDVNQVTPLLTTLNPDGQIEGVKYDRVTAILVKGMQEQQAQIAELQKQNAEQLTQIHDLQAQVSQGQLGSSSASPNAFNVISVIALLGMVGLCWQQRRTRSGGAR